MSPAWSFALARLAGLIAFAVAGGLIFGRLALWLEAVLAGYLLLQLANLYRLQRWLRRRSQEGPPDLGGVWGDVIALINRIYRRKQFHKRRVVELLREFRRLTAAMPDGVVLLSASHDILWFNRKASELLGLRRKFDFGAKVENLIRDPAFGRYLEGGHYSEPLVLRRISGQETWLSLQLISAGDERLLLARDVTREARLEAMRTDFVANASHELRSPLTVVSGYLDQLADDPSIDPAWREPVQEMRRQSERMRLIVEDLLELSRLEASGSEPPYEPVDVGGMLALLQRDVLAREVHPAVRLDIQSDARLLGSENEIHSIAQNLVSNAVKFTPPDGSVTVRWWTDADGGHLAVVDTGVGIPAEHLPRLTERFYRVHKGRARETGGSGLGLAIVKHALQRHGGRLQIESVEGRGSTFTCHFPPKRLGAVSA
jgi:two-component system phosphate regulon sensor histidine kinase PhoR